MNKAHVTDLLSAFLEGGLSYANAEKVKAHLAFCNRCRQELEETKHQRAVLRTTPNVPPPPTLENRVLTAVRQERERMPVQTGSGKFVWPSWFTPMRGLALAATCGIVLVVVRNLPRNVREERAVADSERALAKDSAQAPVAIAQRGASDDQENNLDKAKMKAEPAAAPATGAPAQNEVAAPEKETLKDQNAPAERDRLEARADEKPAAQPMTAASVPPAAPPAAALRQVQTAGSGEGAASQLGSSAPKVVALPEVRKKARLAAGEVTEEQKMPQAFAAKAGERADMAAAPAPQSSSANLMEGSQSAIGTPRELVVKDNDVWQALWKEHMARVPNPPPAPTVDFAHQDVIAIFAGERPTGGYRVIIDDISKTSWNGDTARVVRYHLAGPPAGAVAAQVISYPYLFSIQPHFEGQTFFQKNR